MNPLWDPFAEHNRVNPYPMYHRLRAETPIHRSQTGDYVLTRYQDIKNILQNSDDFRAGNRLEWIRRQVKYLENKSEDFSAITDAMNSFIVMMNPPEHMQLRSILVQAWTDHDVDQLISENIDHLLNKVSDSLDVATDFAQPLPAMTMTRIMGMPFQDYNFLKNVATNMLRSLDMYATFKSLVLIDQAAKDFMGYLHAYLDYREKNPGPDLVSKIIATYRERGLAVSRKQLISICIFMFMAGEETTVNLIGTSVLALSNNPEQLKSLKSNQALLDSVLEEALRFESPVQLLGRIANRDVEYNGHIFKKDETITLSLGAANRDPEIFTEPDRFDIHRNAKQHLAFGAGAHFCLGSWLARKQWKLAIGEFLKRFPDFKVAGPPVLTTMLSVRGLTSLPVAVK